MKLCSFWFYLDLLAHHLFFLLKQLDAMSAKHIDYKLSDRLSFLSILLDLNLFVSSRCIFYKIDNEFDIPVQIFFILVGTYRTSVFECFICKDNTILIAFCVKENSRSVKNMLTIVSIIILFFGLLYLVSLISSEKNYSSFI